MEKRKNRIQRFLNHLEASPILNIGNLPYPKLAQGKVREIYDLEDHLLIVASDRLSAFDVIMHQGIPGKGALLTQLSLFWFDQVDTLLPNHLADDHDDQIDEILKDYPHLQSRSMIVKKLKPLPLEAVVRGYLAGNGWKEYQKTGKLFQYELGSDLLKNSVLSKPLFTPTTKVNEGHDMPVTTDQAAKIVGREVLNQIMNCSFDIYEKGQSFAQKSGLILADTKFEFGQDETGQIYLIDEILTPDSSRYWPADEYKPGYSQASYDKQYVRDFLENSDWDKQLPAPTLPDFVISGTRERYRTALEKLIQ